ncbi:MAG: MgtC/SapB family protein [Deltaproteobacteria bacterium]|nr:MgtC/SapB family protein [Deltaproteobacteria bacterium]
MEITPQITTVFAVRLVLAALLGGLIGLEREYHGRAAGFRTHLLVSLGACLMVLLSEAYALKYAAGTVNSLDPTRIAGQIVTGIGFIGAGTIMREGLSIRGLTTAACLWVAAGLGMAVAAGLYFLSIFTTLVALVALGVLKHLEARVRRGSYRMLSITCRSGNDVLPLLEQHLRSRNVTISDFSVEYDMENRESRFDFTIHPADRLVLDIVESMKEFDFVRKVALH